MAKKTVSFSLEEDIIKSIEDYKTEKKLSSKSAALERIILIFTNFDLESSKSNNSFIPSKIKKEIKEDTDLDKSIKNMYINMPE